MSLGESFSDNEEMYIVAITKHDLLTCNDGENSILDEQGRTGLHYEGKVGNVAVIQALLDMHLDINVTDKEGRKTVNYINGRINEFSINENSNALINNKKTISFTIQL